ncbi:MAG: adenylate kinase [Christensenellales bacterium]
MQLVFLGPPGAGKGTQAEMVCRKYSLAHISTGEMLRSAIREGTNLGKVAKGYIEQGALVPDDVIVGLVQERIRQKDCAKGFLLDGFPRTIPQAEALDAATKLDGAINIEVPFEKIVNRISGRRMCKSCGAVYHVSAYHDSKCTCGGELYQRSDDSAETVKNRLDVYIKQTQPLIAYYENRGILHTIDGDQDVETVFSSICNVLESLQ